MLITDAAVRETAATLAQSLGGDWTLDPEAPADGAAHLIHGDGRAIGFRPIFGGVTVQLWISGNAAPTLLDNATPAEQAAHEAHIAARLPEGHRYNKATTLVTEEDEDPAVIILRTLEDDLLPAFAYKPRYVGHRPWIELFDCALAVVTAERDTPPAPDNPDQDLAPEGEPTPRADTEPQPEGPAEGADAEQPTPHDPEVVPGSTSNAEAETDPEPAPEPAHDHADNGEDSQSALEPTPAPARRPRKRNSGRRMTTTATDPAS
ncbi:hypothetical protein ACFV27_01585 [Streptomyces antimycoticus]|uniref:hypothetical protein n=1 Tax=Streptomyces antimycoticus TaxID=68175 RepID=UPI0036A47658